MNNYIVLDGKQYITPAKQWIPIAKKPSTVRYTLEGQPDVTYGPVVPVEWKGVIRVPYTPVTSAWGSLDDLRTSLAQRTFMLFTDHYGVQYTVHVIGEFPEQSITPFWVGPDNDFDVPVRIIKKARIS